MYHLLDAREEPALGVKFCKICRLAQAADFGIAVLTPLNHNVFLEVGVLFGLERPVLFLSNPMVVASKDLPFDLTHEMLVEFSSDEDLREGLKRELPRFTGKVGKTVQYRELRDALRYELAEMKINRELIVRYGTTLSPALLLRTTRLQGLLERDDLPTPVFDTALRLLHYIQMINAIFAAPFGMSPKSKTHENWKEITDEVLHNLKIVERVIQQSLIEMKQRKPFS
jgi:hypothetical protein